MPHYTDEQGKKHTLSKSEIEIGVNLKLNLQKATGRCNWNVWKREMIKNGVSKDELVTGENLRRFIQSYQKRWDLQPTDTPKTIHDDIGLLNYNKREEQNMVREFNKLRREVTDSQILRDRVADALSNAEINITIPEARFVDQEKEEPTDKVIIAGFADLHIGASVDLPTNKYNEAVARKRVNQYANKLINMIAQVRPHQVYIANIGDMVEHVYMRFSQGFDTELNFGEQIQTAINIVGEFVATIVTSSKLLGAKVFYTGIGGNHDRISGNKKDNVYHDSVATIINGFVQFFSEQMFSNDSFEYLEPDSIYRTHLTVNGVNIKIVHGDLDKITQPNALGKISVYDGRQYKAILGGHLHRYSVMEAGNNQYLITSGSFKGMDKFSDQLSLGSSLSQVVMVVDENGSIQTTNIELD